MSFLLFAAPLWDNNLTPRNDLTFQVEIAKTKQEQEKGLMYRQNLDEHKGMLFLYQESQKLCFWMKNTHVPLDILLLDENNKVIEVIKDMVPQSTKRRCFKAKGKRALEIKARSQKNSQQKKKRIQVGNVLSLTQINF